MTKYRKKKITGYYVSIREQDVASELRPEEWRTFREREQHVQRP